MNVLYLTKAYPIREYKISKSLLRKKNLNIYGVAFSKRFYSKLSKLNNKDKVFKENFDYTNWFKNNGEKNKKIEFYNNKLSEIENKYNFSFNLAITADRYIKNKDEKFIKLHLYNSFKFLKRLIEDNEINIIIGEISSATDYIAYHIANKLNIKYIFPWHARLKNKIAFTDINDNWKGLEQKYSELKQRNLSENEINKIKKFIDNYISSKLIPDYMEYTDKTKDEKVKIKRDDTWLERFKTILFTRKVDIQCGIDYNHSLSYKLISRLKNLFNFFKNYKKEFDDFNLEKDNFALVPLHYQPESSTMTLAPFYLDQVSFVKNLSKTMPIDYYLYVKEHPAMLGKRNKNFYQKLKKIHNVKLIAPNVDIHELLPKANAVITLTNTTGYEAILYDKPLFVFGNVFYDIYDYSYKINNYYELSNKFSKCINNWKKNKEKRSSLRYKFIKAVNDSIYEGNLNHHLKDHSVLKEDNLLLIANSIISIINEFENDKKIY